MLVAITSTILNIILVYVGTFANRVNIMTKKHQLNFNFLQCLQGSNKAVIDIFLCHNSFLFWMFQHFLMEEQPKQLLFVVT